MLQAFIELLTTMRSGAAFSLLGVTMDIACHNAVKTAAGGDVSRVVSPLEGIDQAIHALAEMLRAYQRAEVCVIVTSEAHTNESRLYRADENLTTAARGKRIDGSLAQALLAPADQAVIFNRRGSRSCKASGYDVASFAPREVDKAQFAELANLLETDSFISLPLRSQHHSLGRIHVGSKRVRYSPRELRSLAQLVKQAAVMIENIRLVGRLALEVASEERKRISRDLHDGTIQPYVGLKLGLEALRRKLRGVSDFAEEIDELINIAGDGITQLRHYVGNLKRKGPKKKHPDSLLPAVRTQAQKFTEFYGIETRVLADSDISVTAAVHDEVIQIVREGLSNIRRHTSASQATIRLRESEGRLLLELVNDKAGRNGRKHDFFPRSIGERAKELGGRVAVQHRDGGYTVVAVEFPV